MDTENNTSDEVHMLQKNMELKNEPPKDVYYLIRILFYFLGLLSMLPISFLPTANDYWMYKFRDTNTSWNLSNAENITKTHLQSQFTSTFSMALQISLIFSIAITIALSKKIGFTARLFGSLVGLSIMFIVILSFVKVDTDSWQHEFFVITLVEAVFFSCFSAVLLMTVFQISGFFPPEYFSTLLSGQAIAGILSALIQIVTLGFGLKSDTSGLLYFLIGVLIVIGIMPAVIFATKSSAFYKYYLMKGEENYVNVKLDISKKLVLETFFALKYYYFALILAFGFTMSVNPGVTSLVESTSHGNKWNDVFFKPVVTFLFFHLFDFIGREMARYIKKPSGGLVIFIMAVLRFPLIPLILFCNAQPRSHLPMFLNDISYIILMITFAFSNGYVLNLCVLLIPMKSTPEQQALSSLLLVIILILSLGIFSFISVVLVKII